MSSGSFGFPKRRLFGLNLLLLTLGELFSRALIAIAFIHLARVLEPEAYGMIELTLAILMILTVIVDQGLGPIGTRETAKQVEKVDTLVNKIVSMQMGAALVVTVSLTLSVLFLPINFSLLILIVGYGVTLLGYPFLLNWLFQGWNQMEWVAIPQVIRQSVFATLALVIIHQPEQVILLPLIELVAVGVAATLNIVIYQRSKGAISVNLRSGYDKRLFLESIPVGGSQIIWALRMYLPTILLGIIVGQAASGFFGAPHRIMMVLQGLLMVYFLNIFPIMSEVSSISNRLLTLLQSSMRLLVWPSGMFALLVSLFSSSVIRFVFGDEYAGSESTRVLSILVWLIPVLVWRGHSRNALISINQQREELYCSFSAVILLIVLIFPLMQNSSAVGAAWAMLISELVATILTWWRLKVHLPDVRLSGYIFRLPSIGLLINRLGGAE